MNTAFHSPHVSSIGAPKSTEGPTPMDLQPLNLAAAFDEAAVAAEKANAAVIANMKRCHHAECKTRLMLSDMHCKCGWRFCMKHRHAEEHNCTFQYKQVATAHLSSSLAKCVASSLKDKL